MTESAIEKIRRSSAHSLLRRVANWVYDDSGFRRSRKYCRRKFLSGQSTELRRNRMAYTFAREHTTRSER